MSSLFSATLGLDDKTTQSPRLPKPLLIMLTVTLLAVYASNSFSSPLTAVLFQAKWLPLGILGVTAAYVLHSRGSPTFPLLMAVPMLGLFGVAVLSSWSSPDVGGSFLSLVTVAGSILVAYYVSALVVASDSRRAYFELLANFCRGMIVLTVICVLLRINLGRGSGLTAWADNPNTLAMMLTPGMVVFIAGCVERRPGWQVWHAAFFVIGFYLIWVTNSRAVVIWLGLSIAALWLYRRGPGFTVILAMIGVIILVGWWIPIREFAIDLLGLRWNSRNYGISPLSGREEVWSMGWDLFQRRPILGYGPGTSMELIRVESYKFVRHQGLHFHSSYIMALVELGLLGFIAMMSAIGVTIVRAVRHSGRTRVLPRESWPLNGLPFAMIIGSMGHAVFESWLLNAGNLNMMLFWTWMWMVHHQSQVKIRAVIRREVPLPSIQPGAALATQ